MIEILKPNFIFEDDRGSLIQLVREGYNQINVITSQKGAIRGGHYHKKNREAFYIIKGRLKLTVFFNGKSEEYIFQEKDMFVIREEVIHDFKFLEDTVLVSMYDKGVEIGNGEMDIYVE